MKTFQKLEGKCTFTARTDYTTNKIENRRFGEAMMFIHTMHAMDIHYPAPHDHAPIDRAFQMILDRSEIL